MKSWLFFILWVTIGLAILGWGILLGTESYRFSRTAVALEGKVVDIVSSESEGTSVHGPVVDFYLPNGAVRRYASRVKSSASSYSTGDRIKVFWDPASDKVRLDSFGDLYAPAFFIILVAGFVLFGPVFCVAVWIWIWGWPTKTNRAKMRTSMDDYVNARNKK
jgi:hypothetical protein